MSVAQEVWARDTDTQIHELTVVMDIGPKSEDSKQRAERMVPNECCCAVLRHKVGEAAQEGIPHLESNHNIQQLLKRARITIESQARRGVEGGCCAIQEQQHANLH